MSKVIETHEINKTYKMGSEIIQALKSVSISVNKGEYVAFMGPSGSGKSTLMNIIGCLDSPTSGSYVLAGKDVSDMSENELADIRNKEIGFVFQTFNLLPRATCLDNVALPLVYAGYSKSDRQEIAFKALDNVGLGDRTSHRPNELSGGQRQRVAIARALVNSPSIILADEPTGNLDPATSVGIMKLLDRINREGTTVLMATHDAGIVDQMRKRVIELDAGNVIRDQVRGVYGYTG
jgi:putative ABC transport system ATP-binding protein